MRRRSGRPSASSKITRGRSRESGRVPTMKLLAGPPTGHANTLTAAIMESDMTTQKQDSIFGIIYGRPKVGKTVALISAFPDGLFITPAGGSLSGSHLGWSPETLEVSDSVGMQQIGGVVRTRGQD